MVDLRVTIPAIAKILVKDVKESTVNCFVKCDLEFFTELSQDDESDMDLPMNIDQC